MAGSDAARATPTHSMGAFVLVGTVFGLSSVACVVRTMTLLGAGGTSPPPCPGLPL